MSPSTAAYTVPPLMTPASNAAPGHHFRPSGERPDMFDELRKRAKRQQNQREQRIDSRVKEQRERQLRSFRRTGR
jgi:hypothetical protein